MSLLVPLEQQPARGAAVRVVLTFEWFRGQLLMCAAPFSRVTSFFRVAPFFRVCMYLEARHVVREVEVLQRSEPRDAERQRAREAVARERERPQLRDSHF